MERNVTLEAEEWYVLTNWLRERENRLQYALRPKSREWAFVHDLRRDIERQRRAERRREAGGDRQRDGVTEADAAPDGASTGTDRGAEAAADGAAEAEPSDEVGATGTGATETRGTTLTVTLSDRQVAYLESFLRKRARRLLVRPWRDRERRDVRHLRDHLLAAAGDADREENEVQRNG